MKRSLTNLVAGLLTLAITVGGVCAQGGAPPSRPEKEFHPLLKPAGADGPYGRPSNSPASNVFRLNAASASQPAPYAAGQPSRARFTPDEFIKARKLSTGATTGNRDQGNRSAEAEMRKYLSGRIDRHKGPTVDGKVQYGARGGNRTPANATAKGTPLSPYGTRNVSELSTAMKGGSVPPGKRADVKGPLSIYAPKHIKPDASLIKKLSKNNRKQPSNVGANRRPPVGDTENIAGITRDENGVEHWESSFDEQLAIDNGGRYELTAEDGKKYVTEVTAEGTRRTVILPNGGGVASDTFTPHERRDANSEAGDGGVDTALDIVDTVISHVAPYLPVPAGGAQYYDPGYVVPVVPEYAIPVVPGSAATANTQLIQERSGAGEVDEGLTRFTRRYIEVENDTDKSLTVYVQYRAPNEQGQWTWLPANSDRSQEALEFELAPGQVGYLEHNGAPIAASRVRISGKSASREWAKYQDEDLWLVSEVDANGQRAYFAAVMDTFRFTFE